MMQNRSGSIVDKVDKVDKVEEEALPKETELNCVHRYLNNMRE